MSFLFVTLDSLAQFSSRAYWSLNKTPSFQNFYFFEDVKWRLFMPVSITQWVIKLLTNVITKQCKCKNYNDFQMKYFFICTFSAESEVIFCQVYLNFTLFLIVKKLLLFLQCRHSTSNNEFATFATIKIIYISFYQVTFLNWVNLLFKIFIWWRLIILNVRNSITFANWSKASLFTGWTFMHIFVNY